MTPRWKRAALALDVALLLCALGLRLWAMAPVAQPAPPAPDAPQTREGALPGPLQPLLSPQDVILHGPDAGDWAIQTRRLQRGETPDVRRLPLYPRLTALAVRVTEGIVPAGHLVNHLASLLTVALTFALGALLHGRWAGAGAAFIVATSPKLLLTQSLFGVDPTFHLCALALLSVTLLAARRGTLWALLSGAVAGLTLSTHYLGLLFALLMAPAQLPLGWGRAPEEGALSGGISRGDVARGALRLALYAALALGLFKAMMAPFPPVELRDITEEYAVGILSSYDRPDLDSAQWLTPVKMALARVPGALGGLAQSLTHPFAYLPAIPPALWLLPIGLGLAGPPRPGQRWRPQVALAQGLFLLPLLGLIAANAPERYRLYAEPLAIIAGLGGLSWGVRTLVARLGWPRLAEGLAALPPALVFAGLLGPVQSTWPGPSVDPGQHQREVGLAVRAAFPGRGPIVTTFQEIRFYADRWGCMHDPCPEDLDALTECLGALTASCGGYGDVPYHLQLAGPRGFANQPNPLLDAWVLSVGEEVTRLTSAGRTSAVYRIPEAAMPAPSHPTGAADSPWVSPRQ